MSPQPTDPSANAEQGRPESLLRAIAVCDLVDSTALIEQLGDRKGAAFMQQLDRFARDILQRHRGREIDKTDGFLLLFERPIEAVAFAVEYQRLLRRLGEIEFLPLKARIGIHVGDVLQWENTSDDIARGAKPVEVEGLAKPVAARLMHLALPGQILLSGVAQALVTRSQAEMDGELDLVWKEHGRYRLKGVPEPVPVFEVGERDIAPLAAPGHNAKAYRDVPWWRRRTALIVEAAMLSAIVAAGAYFSLRSPEAIAFAKRDWIVVGDMINQTGEPILNDSLQTAFRIGLEQSRYVNVVSDLKVRSTLQLMQRDTENTKIDRDVGTEVAIRDGARALVMPSIAEVGGRVRVTADVIDPHSKAVVYTESAEGVGFISILPSLDKVSQQLRVRLGEALASVKNDNVPLPQATTSNLDALRAYALALQAFAGNHDSDALVLFRHAVKLDPNFALAYMGIARIYAGADDDANAFEYVKKAVALRDRLPQRDQLYLDAWSARFGPPRDMLEKWKLLARLYPDYYAASYNYAFFSWQLENRAGDGIQAIEPALSPYDPLRGTAYYTLAYMLAADNRFDEADENFKTATSINHHEGSFYAARFFAQRRFAEGSAVLDRLKPTGIATADLVDQRERIAMNVDLSNWERADAAARELMSQAVKVGPLYARAFQAMSLSLDDYMKPPAARIAALRPFIDELRHVVAQPSAMFHYDDLFALSFAGYLAQRAGDTALAQAVIDDVAPRIRDAGYSNLDNMLAAVTANIYCASGKPKEAIALLERLRNGTELYITHVTLADAYASDGRIDDALRELHWLTEHRGRAYLELNSFQILQARNVAESDLASLRMAEVELSRQHVDAAKAELATFLAVWPLDKQTASIASRTQAVRAALGLTPPG
jgi:putative peptide modification system cyclase